MKKIAYTVLLLVLTVLGTTGLNAQELAFSTILNARNGYGLEVNYNRDFWYIYGSHDQLSAKWETLSTDVRVSGVGVGIQFPLISKMSVYTQIGWNFFSTDEPTYADGTNIETAIDTWSAEVGIKLTQKISEKFSLSLRGGYRHMKSQLRIENHAVYISSDGNEYRWAILDELDYSSARIVIVFIYDF